MAWAKLDDGYFTNPKTVAAGLAGRALHLACISYASRELTDGLIPASALPLIGFLAGVPDLAAALTACLDARGPSGQGLLEDLDGGYLVHDYLVYNPSRDQVLAKRAATQRRVKDWRERHPEATPSRNGVTNSVTPSGNAVTNALVTPPPYPSRSPLNTHTDSETLRESEIPARPRARASPRVPPYSPEFLSWWNTYPPEGREDKAGAWTEWQRQQPPADALAAGMVRWLDSDRWHNGYIVPARKFLKERRWEAEPPPYQASAGGQLNGHATRTARRPTTSRRLEPASRDELDELARLTQPHL